MELMPHQIEALKHMHDGCVLWGGVGSGKTITALSYYIQNHPEKDLYVITTAKKRDSLDWEREAARLGIGSHDGATLYGRIVVDSWNNVRRYVERHVDGAFFIFDEQRVVGSGVWVKSFIRLAKANAWILLSATPGDTWLDYAPIFIANGYFRNITEFKMDHVIYAPYVKFPKVVRYQGHNKLERLRNEVLVEMPFEKHTVRHVNWLDTGYDKDLTKRAIRTRWNMFEDRPMVDVAELFRVLRRISNTDQSKMDVLRSLMLVHPKLIVYYNFNYELELLRTLASEITVAEWNGHKKQPIPDTDHWLYLVQYVAGAEGWNCTETDAMVLFSLTYSYKNFMQAQGRIDRLDTPFTDLYYYVLSSSSPIDIQIRRALKLKRNFNVAKTAEEVKTWDESATF
jgi:hypothetical protein